MGLLLCFIPSPPKKKKNQTQRAEVEKRKRINISRSHSSDPEVTTWGRGRLSGGAVVFPKIPQPLFSLPSRRLFARGQDTILRRIRWFVLFLQPLRNVPALGNSPPLIIVIISTLARCRRYFLTQGFRDRQIKYLPQFRAPVWSEVQVQFQVKTGGRLKH